VLIRVGTKCCRMHLLAQWHILTDSKKLGVRSCIDALRLSFCVIARPDPMPPDPMPPRKEEKHIGDKLAEAIAAKGVIQADVARHFGVKPQTVSQDWIKHGRIAKKHIPTLVEYFGLPYVMVVWRCRGRSKNKCRYASDVENDIRGKHLFRTISASCW
jgi:hypothetical protein